MKQILSLNIGQAGVQIGDKCWELFCLEHSIQENGQMETGSMDHGNVHKLFSQTIEGVHVPRTVFIDSQPSVIDEIKVGPRRQIFGSQNNFFSDKEDAGDLFSRGYYHIGYKQIDNVMDKIRKQVQKCQYFEGFVNFHSIGGGTGSGFGCKILQQLSVSYNKKAKICYQITPSAQYVSSPVEPYNAILAFHHLLEHSDANILLDNQSLYNVFEENLDIQSPSFININRLIAQIASSQSLSFRFPSTISMNLNQFIMNMVPYPRLHFLQSKYAPYLPLERMYHPNSSVEKITNDLFHHQNQLISSNPLHGKYLACCLMYRGDISHKEIYSSIDKLKNNQSMRFFDFIPTGIKIVLNSEPPKFIKNGDLAKTMRGGCLISHTSAMAEVLSRIDHKFDLLYARRAFVNWFCGYMEEGEFHEAREDIAQLEKDYDCYGFLEEAWGEEE